MKNSLLLITFLAGASIAAEEMLNSSLIDEVVQYSADRRSLYSFYRLHGTGSFLDRHRALHEQWMEKLQALDYEQQNRQGQIDYLLLSTRVQSEFNSNRWQASRTAEIQPLLTFTEVIRNLDDELRARKQVDAKNAADRLTQLLPKIRDIRRRLDAGLKAKKEKAESDAKEPAGKDTKGNHLTVEPHQALYASQVCNQFKGSLERWYRFYASFKPGFTWWVKKPFEAAIKELNEYHKFLRERVAGVKGKEPPMVGLPVGRARLLELLKSEWISYTPDELISIANEEFKWCEAELDKAAKDMKQKDRKAALNYVKGIYVPPGEQDLEVARLGQESIDFTLARKFVTVPMLCLETWRLRMLDEKGQKMVPYASYGGQQVNVAYATETMTHEKKLMSMRGNNKHFLRNVILHELVPGHHLQHFMQARHNTHRGLFSTPFYVEGWALYCELQFWNMGFPQSPEDRIGMLFWRMHRCARIIVTLKYHLGQMKPPEMVKFLTDRVGHEPEAARSEIRRFIHYRPLYQCGYMLGGMQLLKLHEELVGEGKPYPRQQLFHDRVLMHGPIPIALLRRSFRDEKISKDLQPTWRFRD